MCQEDKRTDLLCEFTDRERAVVEKARQAFLHTVQVIAELHDIRENVVLAPDGSGLMKPASLAARVAQHAPPLAPAGGGNGEQ